MPDKTSTILIVDNDPGASATLRGFLFSEGYELIFAGSGPEALTKARETIPDLILLDVMMPGMTGFEVCQRLRADSLLAEVPIIMVTALDDREARLQAIEFGADDFISKPVDRTELRARVRAVTRLNRYRRLLSERAKFEWVIEQASEGYLIVDDKGYVIYANPQAQLYLEMDAKSPFSEPFRELAERYYRCEPQAAWATWPNEAALASKLPTDGSPTPLYLMRPETSVTSALWLQVSILHLPASAEGGARHIIRLQDVTEKKLLLSKLNQFHMMVSHKLRTPLTYMLGSLELLQQHLAELANQEALRFSGVALRGAQRLHGEIEDILSYVTARSLAQTGDTFSLAQLPALVAELGNNLQLETITVSDCDTVKERETLISRRGIELILGELLENSKKFHPQQTPSVDITVSQVDAHQVMLRVKDNGQTLSPEQLARVWEPYYQAEKLFTGEVVGMGLGLSVVFTLVWNAGGMSRIYNRDDGPGVVVEVILPLRNSGS